MTTYVVWVQDVAGGSTTNIGPFRTEDAAQRMLDRCRRHLRRQGDLYNDDDAYDHRGGTDVGIEPLVAAADWRQAL